MFTRQSGARRRHLLETLLTGWDSDADDWVFDDFFFWCDMWELGDNGARHGVPPCPLKSPCTATWSDWKLDTLLPASLKKCGLGAVEVLSFE